METEDIIGQEFTGVEFDSKGMMINYHTGYAKLVGKKGTVKKINDSYPEYTEIKFPIHGYYHYPTKLVKEQIEANQNRPMEEIINELKYLTSRI
jgi:hypothetical protein